MDGHDDATAPPMEEDMGKGTLESHYPMLYELMHPKQAAEAAVANGSDDATSSTSLSPLNQCCPLCQQGVTAVTDKPVVLLPCGHAYHVMCGRMYLSRPEGRECTVDTCHRTEHQVEVVRLRRIVDAAIARNEFKLEDLQDPVLRRDIMVRVSDLLEGAQHAGDASRVASKAVSAAAAADEEQRSEEAYRVRWLSTRVGREGFNFMQKMRMLSPYMKNPMAVKRELVTMGRLLELEEQYRQDAIGEGGGEGAGTNVAVHVEAAIGNADDMCERISINNFVHAGLTLSDIFFGLELRGWQPLVDAGFKKEFITDKNGPFPLAELVDLYVVDYKSLQDIGWSIDDVVEKRHTPQELADLGLSFRGLWTDMGMSRNDFMDLSYSASKWHDVLGLDKKYLERPLGIGTAELELMRWTVPEFVKAFDLHPMEQRALGLSEHTPAKVRDAPARRTVASGALARPKRHRRNNSVVFAASMGTEAKEYATHRRPKQVVKVLTLDNGRT